MNPASTSFVLGYHGCDGQVADRVLSGKQPLRASNNDYDWLGSGMYFWEHNAQRAYDFAREIRDRPNHSKHTIKQPAVIGAIIDLGFCLNLLDARFIQLVRKAHDYLERISNAADTPLPTNSVGPDLLLRKLDCAVIRTLHAGREDAGEIPFDTVRAAFVECARFYPNAGFAARNHVQICVRNIACIKGYFRPLDEDGTPLTFA